MINVAGSVLGVEAARRLAGLGFAEIRPGLTDAEFAGIEQRFGFEFADDHRAFLAAGLPVWTAGYDDHPDKASWGWPDWRDGDSETLQRQVDWPVTSALSEIRHGEWPSGWGRRPQDPEKVMAKALQRLADVPRMVPVYGHRYLPAGRGTFGHPVLSIHRLNDIVVYGLDLIDYVGQEFREPEVTVAFWRDYL